MLVFVYGTLKRGYYNNHLLESSKYVGDGFTLEKFCMINAGCPVIQARPGEQNYPVAGEVWDIGKNEEVLAELDRLESEGRVYDRIAVPVFVPSKKGQKKKSRLTAQVYVGTQMFADRPHNNEKYLVGNNLVWR